ncbi:hypothetical protein IQ216_11870 [Cyanobium sp. LEGE 06143]|nr:hypothetical protein [Cyanobium sp. LEGE 06143]
MLLADREVGGLPLCGCSLLRLDLLEGVVALPHPGWLSLSLSLSLSLCGCCGFSCQLSCNIFPVVKVAPFLVAPLYLFLELFVKLLKLWPFYF